MHVVAKRSICEALTKVLIDKGAIGLGESFYDVLGAFCLLVIGFVIIFRRLSCNSCLSSFLQDRMFFFRDAVGLTPFTNGFSAPSESVL